MMTWNSSSFQHPSSLLMELILGMHDFVMIFLSSIMFLVFINLMFSYVISSFNFEFFESHQLENLWTIGPFIIIIFIITPSLESLYSIDTCLFCGLSLNIVGHQWYWSYMIKDLSYESFDSYMVPADASAMRLIEVDNRLVIPEGIPVRFAVGSADVIHSWTIPSLGIKMDAVPGRVNQFCLIGKRTGVFFGQCSEICGANHSFMPIVLECVKCSDFLKL